MIEKTDILRIRISPTLKKNFENLCKSKGISLSEYLRFIIIQELEKNKTN